MHLVPFVIAVALACFLIYDGVRGMSGSDGRQAMARLAGSRAIPRPSTDGPGGPRRVHLVRGAGTGRPASNVVRDHGNARPRYMGDPHAWKEAV